MRGLAATLLPALLLPVLCACNFGTLASLSEDQAASGGQDVTGTAVWFWTNYGSATDANVAARMTTMNGVIDETGLIPIQVTIGDLASSNLTPIGFQSRDPSTAQGMLIVTDIDCPLAAVEPYIIATNQAAIYPGIYDSYQRAYTSSSAAYLARTTPTLTWNTNYAASVLGRSYNANVSGSVRYVPTASPTSGPVILVRSFLTSPANFTQGNDSTFKQDYQIEVYYERTPGTTTHFYGVWRDFTIASLTSESQLYIGIVLGNLVDFDNRTGIVCKNGMPPAVTTQ